MASWKEIRERHPATWLVIEALNAHSSEGRRMIKDARVIAIATSGGAALSEYRDLHRNQPTREFYFVHTTLERLALEERLFLGLFRSFSASSSDV